MVRKDLSPSQQAVQSCHAIIEATRLFIAADQIHPHLVLCGVKNEEALEREASRLEAYGIRFAVFHEPDRNNEITALATAPVAGDIRKAFNKFNLLQQEEEARAPP